MGVQYSNTDTTQARLDGVHPAFRGIARAMFNSFGAALLLSALRCYCEIDVSGIEGTVACTGQVASASTQRNPA